MQVTLEGNNILGVTSSLINATIIGASGYSGAELVRLLARRDDVHLQKLVAHSSAGKRFADIYPAYAGTVDATLDALDLQEFEPVDVAFIALPSGEAMKIVPQLLLSAKRVIDLGGDFRFSSPELYEQFYKHKHTAPGYLSEAVYGLPELNKSGIASARLVANPGCYPTSAILALLPALKYGIVSSKGIVINSLSGVSGAGRSASEELSFSEVNENIRAYKVGAHQHIPEIQSVLEHATGKEVSLSFVPHLVPITRGIYTTVHANLETSIDEKEVTALYQEFYRDAPFVRIKEQVPQIKNVVHSNYCDIGFAVERMTNQLIIMSVIDNLVKGAAGQAVQNFNIMFGLPEGRGLL
jgi:N-acetyl-gamma-glutamyl-phosphate reductase